MIMMLVPLLLLKVTYVLNSDIQLPCLRELGNKSMKEFEPNNVSKLKTVINE